MRILPMGVAAAVAMFGIGIAASHAAPVISFGAAPDAVRSPLVQVQMVCNPARCVDPRTGAFTQSSCNGRGCYPISGVMGYTNSTSYGSSYPEHRWERRHERDYNWGR